jgi:hypothetical protein
LQELARPFGIETVKQVDTPSRGEVCAGQAKLAPAAISRPKQGHNGSSNGFCNGGLDGRHFAIAFANSFGFARI